MATQELEHKLPSSLLDIHPHIHKGADIDPYFSLGEKVTPAISQFWLEAHKLSCSKRNTLKATPAEVRSDFRTSDGCESLCVREALGGECIDIGDEGDGGNLVRMKTTEVGAIGSLMGSISLSKQKLGKAISEETWNAAAEYISSVLKKDSAGGVSQKAAVVVTSSAAKTPQKSSSIVGGVFRRFGGAVTSILASYDLVDDPEDYGEGDYDEPDDYYNGDLSSRKIKLEYYDIIINIPLVVQCCNTIFEKASQLQGETSIEPDKLLLHRNGIGNRSFRKLCKDIAEMEKLENSDVLKYMNNQDAEFLVRVFLRADRAQESEDGDIIALMVGGSKDKKLSQSSIAMFQMVDAIEKMESRMSELNEFSEKAKEKAIKAKRNKQTNIAVIHMKRRAMALKEMEQCGNTILNLETGLETLKRSINDVEVVKCLEICKDALKSVRTGELEKAEDICDDYADELNEHNDLTASIKSGSETLIHGAYDINEEELEKEFLELEHEHEEEKKLLHDVEKNNADADERVEEITRKPLLKNNLEENENSEKKEAEALPTVNAEADEKNSESVSNISEPQKIAVSQD